MKMNLKSHNLWSAVQQTNDGHFGKVRKSTSNEGETMLYFLLKETVTNQAFQLKQ